MKNILDILSLPDSTLAPKVNEIANIFQYLDIPHDWVNNHSNSQILGGRLRLGIRAPATTTHLSEGQLLCKTVNLKSRVESENRKSHRDYGNRNYYRN